MKQNYIFTYTHGWIEKKEVSYIHQTDSISTSGGGIKKREEGFLQ